MIAAMSAALETAQSQWREGHRRFQELVRESRGERLYRELETISDELRRRIGQTFALVEAAELYRSAERWAPATLAERHASSGWPRDLAVVIDEAFYLYSRAAVDYLP